MSTPGLISHDDSRIDAGSGSLRQQRRRRRDHDARGVRRERVQHPRAGGRDLQVRLKAAIRIDLRRRERQHLPLDHRRRGAFEDRQEERDVADGVRRFRRRSGRRGGSCASGSRFAAAATASARTGEVAPLMRWRGDSSPVSRRTPVSSDRNASDGALDMPSTRADSAQSQSESTLRVQSTVAISPHRVRPTAIGDCD